MTGTLLNTLPAESLLPRPMALLVEDSLVNQQLLAFMLEHEGFDVVIASNGLESLEEFKQQPFDVIIMDIQMPIMDGLEATRLIRDYEKNRLCKHTPIVAVTAGMDRGSCMAAGVDAYMEKPVRSADFHEVLSKVCRISN